MSLTNQTEDTKMIGGTRAIERGNIRVKRCKEEKLREDGGED